MDNIMQDVTHVEEIDGEEFASIIDSESSTINQSAFQRYAVPPQFDGNSSEEENEPQLEEKQAELVPDENAEDMDADNAGYAPLIADEFGEFVSSEDFEYHAPDRVGYLQDLTHSESNQSSEPAEAIAGATNSAASSVRVSIAPLDANKIQTIKAAMSKITIKQPNSGAVMLADALELKRLRLGDEISE